MGRETIPPRNLIPSRSHWWNLIPGINRLAPIKSVAHQLARLPPGSKTRDEQGNLRRNHTDCGRRTSGSIICRIFEDLRGPCRSKVDYFGTHQRSLANHDGGRQISTMVQRHAGGRRYASARSQIEVSREGDGRVNEAIVVYRDCCRVCARTKARLDRWDVSDFDGPTFF